MAEVRNGAIQKLTPGSAKNGLVSHPVRYGTAQPHGSYLRFAVPALPNPAWPIADGVVSLRPFTMDDVAEVTRACRDPEISRWILSIPSPYEEHHSQWWIAQHDSQWAEGTPATFAFCPVSNVGLFGSMALEEIDRDRQTAVASYWAAPWARNRGNTTRALRLVCLWAFEALHIEIVTLTTLEGNRASERVAEKSGFHLVEQISEYKFVGDRDPQASYEVKRWMREQQSRPTGTST